MPTLSELVQIEGILADANIDTTTPTYSTTPTIGTTLKTIDNADTTGQFVWTDSGQSESKVTPSL